MRWKLFWSILAACMTLVATVTVAAEIAQQAAARQREFESLALQGAVVATRLQGVGTEASRSTARRELADFLEGVEAGTEFAIRVGRLAGPSIEFLNGRSGSVGEAAAAELLAGETVMTRSRSGTRSETLTVMAPFDFDGSVGVVTVQREIRLWSIGSVVATWRIPFLVAVMVSAVAAMLVAGRFTRRLRALVSAVEGYAAGRRIEVPVAGADEVAEVAAAFNSLSKQLDDARVREREFLMDVSHDLRTPLTTIVGYSEMLGRHDDPATARVGEALARESHRLSRLVDDLMVLGRLQASQFDAVVDDVDLAPVVDTAARGLAARAAAKEVSVVAETHPTPVRTDAGRVTQILGNLADNALRHTPAGGRIELSVRPGAAGGAVLTVTDTGSGVAADRLAHLFDRLTAGPERPAGSGLGLAIVRALVDLLGGTVHAHNRDEGGLVVTLELPAAPPG